MLHNPYNGIQRLRWGSHFCSAKKYVSDFVIPVLYFSLKCYLAA